MGQLFGSTLKALLVLFIFIGIGVFFGKKKFLPEGSEGTLSKLETYLFLPALSLRTCINHCRMEKIREYISYFSVSLATVCVLFILSNLLAKKFAQKEGEHGIYTYALTTSNIGYMGQPLTLAVFGEEMLFKYIIAGIPFNLYIYSLGLSMMSGKRITWRSFMTPVFFATFLGIALGLGGIQIPSVLDDVLEGAANCMSPLAMLIAGLSIAKLPVGKLLGGARAYVVSALRLIGIPVATVAVLALCGASREMMLLLLILTAMPIGMNTIVFPASAGVDSTAGAKLVLISNVFSMITIPVLFLLFGAIFPA